MLAAVYNPSVYHNIHAYSTSFTLKRRGVLQNKNNENSKESLRKLKIFSLQDNRPHKTKNNNLMDSLYY